VTWLRATKVYIKYFLFIKNHDTRGNVWRIVVFIETRNFVLVTLGKEVKNEKRKVKNEGRVEILVPLSKKDKKSRLITVRMIFLITEYRESKINDYLSRLL
jgi:hypothetical protein